MRVYLNGKNGERKLVDVKLVKSASTLQALLVSHEVPEGAADLSPEQYGPSDTIYSTVSESARLDQADARQEAEGNAPQFSGAGE